VERDFGLRPLDALRPSLLGHNSRDHTHCIRMDDGCHQIQKRKEHCEQ